MPLPIFQYHADVIARYPNLIAGALLFHGVANGPAPETLRNAFQAEQQSTLARIGSTPLSDIPSLAAWRSVFRSFGVEPTQYRSAPEALLRRLTKTGDLPTINTLVDLGNLVSIRYGLPVAIFDLRAVRGLITVCFADGSEHYTPLGQSEVEHPEQGEVIFVDTGRAVLARRWCWRQGAQSAVRSDTTTALLVVEAHHPHGRDDVQAALAVATDLLVAYGAIPTASAILDATSPALLR